MARKEKGPTPVVERGAGPSGWRDVVGAYRGSFVPFVPRGTSPPCEAVGE